jgi:hypothetical protein
MFKISALAVALGLASHVQAETFRPLPNTAALIDLDTGDGNFSAWEAQDLSGANGLRAHFRINRLGTNKKWAPTFKFKLGNGQKSVSFSITGLAGKKLLIPSIKHSASAQAKDEIFVTFLEVGQTADLTMTWTVGGGVTINLRSPQSLATSQTGETHTAKLGSAPDKFSLTGSTGEIEVMSFQLGTTAP